MTGNRWRIAGWGAAGLLLLIPLAASQVFDGVSWTTFDYLFAAALLGLAGLGLEVAFHRRGNRAYQAASALAILTALMLVVANGAVGFIGDEDQPANLVFHGVLVLIALGAAAARLRPAGMARAMGLGAFAQVLAPVVAWAGWADTAGLTSPQVWGATGVFAALWLAAAILFAGAARYEARTATESTGSTGGSR